MRGCSDPGRGDELRQLLTGTFNISEEAFWIRKDQPAPPAGIRRFRHRLNRWLRGEPLAYLLGYRYFYDRRFTVTPRVLIPRPETELLVRSVIRAHRPGEPILELGSGCGNIAITLALETGCPVTAVEKSRGALKVFRRNIRRLGARGRVIPRRGNLLTGRQGPYQAVVSNPPYIRTGELAGLPASVRDFEPRMALDGGEEGLDFIGPIIRESPRVLGVKGRLFLEIGHDQHHAVRRLLDQNGYTGIRFFRDLNGHRRVVEARR